MPVPEPGCPALWRQGLRKTGISLVPKKPMVRHLVCTRVSLSSDMHLCTDKALNTSPSNHPGLIQVMLILTSLSLTFTHRPYMVLSSLVIDRCTVLVVLPLCVCGFYVSFCCLYSFENFNNLHVALLETT